MKRAAATAVLAITLASCAMETVSTTSSADVTQPSPVPARTIQPVPPPAQTTSGIKLDTERAVDDITLRLSGPVRRGSTASASVRTAPHAICTISIGDGSPPSGGPGLEPKNADGSGGVSWSWTVGANTAPGALPVEVTCTFPSGQRSIAREPLTVE